MADGPMMSLEDDDGAVTAAASLPAQAAQAAPAAQPPAAEPAPAPTVTAPAPAEDEIDPNTVDPKDVDRVRGLLAELSRKRGENRDLKQKAADVDRLRQEVENFRPYAQFLQANPQLMQPRQPEAPAAPKEGTPDDAEALAAAKLYDFYGADGKPDAARGRAHLTLVRQQAEQIAQQMIGPMQQQSQQERAQANWNQAIQAKDADGRPVDPQALTAVWRQIASEPNGLTVLSDPRGAAFLVAAALGMERMSKKLGGGPVVPPPSQPPVVTEASGGRATPRGQTVSELEQDVMSRRKLSQQQYQDLTKGFNRGRSSILED